MARDVGLLQRLREQGVDVIEIAGWQTRGSTTFNPRGSVNHHTAGARNGVVPSLNTCLNGRPDVPGPLCHVLLGRDNKARLIAAGRANHAGLGGFKGLTGNSSVYGLEIEHVGTTAEPISPTIIDTAARIHAAFLRGPKINADMVAQHWQWAPTRKIDFVKGSLDPSQFQMKVQRYINYPGGNTPAYKWAPLHLANPRYRDGTPPLAAPYDSEVAEVQLRLLALSQRWSAPDLNPGPLDRIYGPTTAGAVSNFKKRIIALQTAMKLPVWPNSDYTVGPITIGALRFWSA